MPEDLQKNTPEKKPEGQVDLEIENKETPTIYDWIKSPEDVQKFIANTIRQKEESQKDWEAKGDTEMVEYIGNQIKLLQSKSPKEYLTELKEEAEEMAIYNLEHKDYTTNKEQRDTSAASWTQQAKQLGVILEMLKNNTPHETSSMRAEIPAPATEKTAPGTETAEEQIPSGRKKVNDIVEKMVRGEVLSQNDYFIIHPKHPEGRQWESENEKVLEYKKYLKSLGVNEQEEEKILEIPDSVNKLMEREKEILDHYINTLTDPQEINLFKEMKAILELNPETYFIKSKNSAQKHFDELSKLENPTPEESEELSDMNWEINRCSHALDLIKKEQNKEEPVVPPPPRPPKRRTVAEMLSSPTVKRINEKTLQEEEEKNRISQATTDKVAPTPEMIDFMNRKESENPIEGIRKPVPFIEIENGIQEALKNLSKPNIQEIVKVKARAGDGDNIKITMRLKIKTGLLSSKEGEAGFSLVMNSDGSLVCKDPYVATQEINPHDETINAIKFLPAELRRYLNKEGKAVQIFRIENGELFEIEPPQTNTQELPLSTPDLPRRTVEDMLTPLKENPADLQIKEQRYVNAKKIVQESGRASTAVLQRRLRVGFDEAMEMIERMRREGIIPPKENLQPIEPTPATPLQTLRPPLLSSLPETPPRFNEYGEQLRELTEEEAAAVDILNNAREEYAEAYKEFLQDRRKTLGLLRSKKERYLGGTIPNSEIPDSLQQLEAKYNGAIVAYGNAMLDAKRNELNVAHPGMNNDSLLNIYKQTTIFERVIIKEQELLNELKAENLPPKEKGIFKKSLDWYRKLGKLQKIGVSLAFSGAVITASSAAAIIAGAGVGATLTGAGIAMTRRVIKAGIMGTVATPVISKGVGMLTDRALGNEEEIAEQKINQLESSFDITQITNIKERYAAILEEERKAKRTKLILKAALAAGAGIGVGTVIGHEMGNIINAAETNGSGRSIFVETNKEINPPATPESLKTPEITKPEEPTPQTSPTPLPPEPSGTPKPNLTETPNIPKESLPQTSNDQSIEDTLKNATVHKGEGVEHAFIRQIKADPNLAQELANKSGFKGDLTNEKILERFAGQQAHKIALQTGYVDRATGAEVRVAEADKVAYEIQNTNGQITVLEKRTDGTLLETYTEGEKFGTSKASEYEYRAKKVPIMHSTSTTTEELLPKVGSAEEMIPHTENPSIPEPGATNLLGPDGQPLSEELINHQEKVQQIRKQITEKIVRPREAPLDKSIQTTSEIGQSEKTTQILNENPALKKAGFVDLDAATRAKTFGIYQENIKYITTVSDDYRNEWHSMQRLKATDIMDSVKEGNMPGSPLGKYLEKLYKVTKLDPHNGTWWRDPETVNEYTARALKRAAEMGRLEDVTLK